MERNNENRRRQKKQASSALRDCGGHDGRPRGPARGPHLSWMITASPSTKLNRKALLCISHATHTRGAGQRQQRWSRRGRWRDSSTRPQKQKTIRAQAISSFLILISTVATSDVVHCFNGGTVHGMHATPPVFNYVKNCIGIFRFLIRGWVTIILTNFI